MSLEQLGARLGVTAQAAANVEASEARGSLSLARLRRAADAMECDVVVLVVPRRPMETVLRERAQAVAHRDVRRVGHTMAMEAQEVGQATLDEIQRLAAEAMIEINDRRIWST